MKKLLLALVAIWCLPVAGVSQTAQTGSDYVAKRIQLTLLNAPQPVASASVSVSGNPGPATYFYWIVTNTGVGASSPAGPFVATNAPNTLSGSNFSQISWRTVPDAVTYDVLRTSTQAYPFGACNCAVATAVSGNTTNDQANALNTYTVNTLDPSIFTITLSNTSGTLSALYPSNSLPGTNINAAFLNGLGALEYLGSTFLAASASSTSTVTIAAKDYLICRGRITGYGGGGDIAMWVWNGDVTAANYQTRYIIFSNAATPLNTSVNFCSAGCSAAAGGIPLGDAAITVGRNNEIECTNFATKNKVCNLRHSWESTSSTVFNSTGMGYAEWFNTTNQITNVKLVTLTGQVMGAGSGFVCFGKTF
jgi:hypothetical protein